MKRNICPNFSKLWTLKMLKSLFLRLAMLENKHFSLSLVGDVLVSNKATPWRTPVYVILVLHSSLPT